MARLTDEQRGKILADFNIGKSQNELARKYNVSTATINKLCKGLVPKYKEKVNTVASIKSELLDESEYQNECFDKEVNERLKHKEFLFKASIKNISTMIKKINEETTIGEHFVAQNAIDKASLTLGINPRHANSQVSIQNTNAVQTTIDVSKLSDKELSNYYLDLVKK